MTNAERFLLSILKNGVDATITVYSGGTQCPCMISRGSEAPAYSADWHRRNPTATDCEGTGLINSTTSTVKLKTMIIDAALIGDALKSVGEMVDIGIKSGDMALYGAVNSETMGNYSLADLTDKNIITVLDVTYSVKRVYRIPMGETVITAAVIRRLE